MFDEYLTIQKILAALLAGYLLGSIPFAQVAARLRGVDIFDTGTSTAGAANVFWYVGHRTGLIVGAGDVGKGAAAVVIAGFFDLPDSGLLLVGGAAILGHWKSAFAGFRGGDGMATLLGVGIVLEPTLAVVGILVGLAVVSIL